MECPYCGENKKYLLKMPVVIVKETSMGAEATYTRSGFKADNTPDNICIDCLQHEADECL